MRRDPRTGLYVIAGTTRLSGADALSLLSSSELATCSSLAREAFDLVIIDAAPLLPIIDSRLLIEQVDGVVMVVASGRTNRDAVSAALRETPGLEDKMSARAEQGGRGVRALLPRGRSGSQPT